MRSLHSRFSAYFTPKENKLFREAIDASFSGAGMTVNEIKRGLVVTSVYPGTPAKRAGIKPGDEITRVNGKSIAGEPSSVSTARIKGPPGTFVTLTVDSGRKTRDVKVRQGDDQGAGRRRPPAHGQRPQAGRDRRSPRSAATSAAPCANR